METTLKVKLLASTPEAEKLVATAAKLCYSALDIDELQDNLTDESIDKFLKMLVSMGHESPVEHVNFSFAVEGVSRSLTHQLVRHRIASYSQQSQRYVGSSQFKYIVPPSIAKDLEAKQIFLNQMEYTQETYNNLVGVLLANKCSVLVPCGISKEDAPSYLAEENNKLYKSIEKKCYEDARYVLPNCAETKIILTMNVRTLYNFFHHRCCDRAQWEIRELARQMLVLAKEVAPTLFAKSGPRCVYGKCPEGAMSCGNQLEMKKIYA